MKNPKIDLGITSIVSRFSLFLVTVSSFITIASLAQRIEFLIPIQEVAGSSPARGTSLSSNREDAALSQRRCGFEPRRGYFAHVAYCCVCCGDFSVVTFLHGLGWVWFSSLFPYLGSWSCFAPLAQLVEQETLNLRVVGSSPTGRTLCSFGMLATRFVFKACRALRLS